MTTRPGDFVFQCSDAARMRSVQVGASLIRPPFVVHSVNHTRQTVNVRLRTGYEFTLTYWVRAGSVTR